MESIMWYNMRLSTAIWGGVGRTFLGFTLTIRGIEANPDNFQATINMRSSSNIK